MRSAQVRKALLITMIAVVFGACSTANEQVPQATPTPVVSSAVIADPPTSPSPNVRETSSTIGRWPVLEQKYHSNLSELLSAVFQDEPIYFMNNLSQFKGEWEIGRFEFTAPGTSEDQFDRDRVDQSLRGERMTVNDDYTISFLDETFKAGKIILQPGSLEMTLVMMDNTLTHIGIYIVGSDAFWVWEEQWMGEYEGYKIWGMYEMIRIG